MTTTIAHIYAAAQAAKKRADTTVHDISVAATAVQLVAQHFGLKLSDLDSPGRAWRLVWPRWIAINLVRRHTSLTLSQVGAFFGRDHSTIKMAVTGLTNHTTTNRNAAKEYATLEAAFLLLIPNSPRSARSVQSV